MISIPRSSTEVLDISIALGAYANGSELYVSLPCTPQYTDTSSPYPKTSPKASPLMKAKLEILEEIFRDVVEISVQQSSKDRETR